MALVAQHHALDFVVSKSAAVVDVDVYALVCQLAPDSSRAPGERFMMPFRMQVLKCGRIAG